MSNTKVSVVSYLNSKVFIKGLIPLAQNEFEISLDIPSKCAEKLINKTVDIGLIPVAVIPEIEHAQIISDYCISANGAVNSVFLFSDTELNKIHTIYLDKHSRTSNLLCKILANEYWKIKVRYLQDDHEHYALQEGEGFVLIGDRTFDRLHQYAVKMDLAEQWKAFTGLPFVFAAWVANKEIEKQKIDSFNAYLKKGFDFMEEVISENELTYFDVNDYLKNKIEYSLNDEKRTAIELYLEKSKLYRG